MLMLDSVLMAGTTADDWSAIRSWEFRKFRVCLALLLR